MNITKISPAVKTDGRYNVFVDNEFSFSLDETQLVTLGLKKGDAIDELQLSELKNESDFGKNIFADLGIEGEYEGIGHCALGYAVEPAKKAAPRKEDYVYYIR